MDRVGLDRRMIVLLVLAALLGCAGGKGVVIEKTEPVVLEYALEEGQQYSLKLIDDENMLVAVSVNEQTILRRTQMDLDVTVTGSSPDGYELHGQFSNIKATVLYGQTVEAVKELNELEGRDIEIELDTDGEILAWSGLADTDLAGSGMAELWISGWFPKLPARAVLPGDTWEHKMDVPPLGAGQAMSIDLVQNYTLESFVLVDDVECARIGVTGIAELDGRIEEAGSSWQVSGSGTIEGRMIVEVATGMPKTHKVKTKINLEGTSMAEGQTDRESVTLRIESTSDLKRGSD